MERIKSGNEQMDYIRDTFHKILFNGEKLRAVNFAELVDFYPTNEVHEFSRQTGNFDGYFALTDWRLITSNITTGRFRSEPFETSEFQIQKKLFGKNLFMFRSYVVANESLDLMPFYIYSVDKKFLETFESLQLNNPKIPRIIETSEPIDDFSTGSLMIKCSECEQLNYDPKSNSGSPYKDVCSSCLRKLR